MLKNARKSLVFTFNSVDATLSTANFLSPKMKSPAPTSTTHRRRRNLSSDHRSTPERFGYSPAPSHASSVVTRRNPVAAAVRSVTGIFTACFTPPEANSSKSFIDSEEFKSSSGSLVFFFFNFVLHLCLAIFIFFWDVVGGESVRDSFLFWISSFEKLFFFFLICGYCLAAEKTVETLRKFCLDLGFFLSES